MPAPVDFSSVTSVVDLSTLISSLLLVAAASAGLYITQLGIRIILDSINNDSSSAKPISKELSAFERYVRGEFITRDEYNSILSRNPNLSGGRQSRDYAKKMVKSGSW